MVGVALGGLFNPEVGHVALPIVDQQVYDVDVGVGLVALLFDEGSQQGFGLGILSRGHQQLGTEEHHLAVALVGNVLDDVACLCKVSVDEAGTSLEDEGVDVLGM